jgi:hypothetical protein
MGHINDYPANDAPILNPVERKKSIFFRFKSEKYRNLSFFIFCLFDFVPDRNLTDNDGTNRFTITRIEK